MKLLRRTALVTTAEKTGYGERAVRLSFRTHPKSTVRIYRRSLQWAMYGADPQRTQAHDEHHACGRRSASSGRAGSAR